MLPSNLPELLRKHGLTVVEIDGWKTRGRPASTGGFAPVGVLCHHTASSANGRAAIPLLVNGRSDLPGPLCHLSLDRQGVVYVVAAGRANHAGKAKASGSVAAGDGNTLYIGIEAQNAGTGEKWPKAQYDAYVLLAAVLSVEVTHNSAQTVRGHKETSVTGKIDPAGPTPYEATFDMGKFRDRVAAQIAALKAPAAKSSAPAEKPKYPTAVQEEIKHLNQLQHQQEANGHHARAEHTKAAKQELKKEHKK
jgi:N-acetyl-anhydromuramyl-L-alanine amidase AmpD